MAHNACDKLWRAKIPLHDAAAANTTRWALHRRLKVTNLPVEVSSGGRTKYNRARLKVPKTHALDAACVGKVIDIRGWQCPTLSIRAMGRGAYKRTRLTKHGFPRGYLMRTKQIHGFQTGDRVRADVYLPVKRPVLMLDAVPCAPRVVSTYKREAGLCKASVTGIAD